MVWHEERMEPQKYQAWMARISAPPVPVLRARVPASPISEEQEGRQFMEFLGAVTGGG